MIDFSTFEALLPSPLPILRNWNIISLNLLRSFSMPIMSCGYADSLHKEKQHTYLLQESVVSSAFPKGTDFLDLEQYEKQHGTPKKLYLDDSFWPKHFIFLCDWGCGFFSFLHAKTGHVYYFGEDYLFYQASSLEEWLERWLWGENLEDVDWA